MQHLTHRALLIFAAMLFATVGSSSVAQQTAPDQPPSTQQTPTSVPPGPPPDRQTSPSTPPPFPPMPSRAPRHRWVDMGEHHSSRAHHRTTHVTHKSSPRHHRTTKSRRSDRSHRSTHAHHKATPSMSKKEIRRCHSMTYHQLLRHKDCAALLQTELNAAHHAKHKTAARRHKAGDKHQARQKARHRETRHRTSGRHRRS